MGKKISLQCTKTKIEMGKCMIRKMEEKDISDVLQIWLETNIKAHSFIDKEYWTGNYEMVKQILPEAEVYVYEEGKKWSDRWILSE